MRLKDKIAFITGASRGIGAAIARRFSAEGACVCLAARTDASRDAIAAEIAGHGGDVLSVNCDVTNRISVSAAISAAVTRWNRIDILVNNAGSSGLTPLDRVDDSLWDRILATNLTAAFRVSQEALPFLPTGGRIINQSSVLGRFGVPGQSAYAASKHAVIGLTRTMALELAPRKITVNAICPGWVETDMALDGWKNLAASRRISVDDARAMAARMAPLGRVLAPDEIAGLAVYIASDEAANLTGQAIVLDGGQVMP